jgi:hypothetical protein
MFILPMLPSFPLEAGLMVFVCRYLPTNKKVISLRSLRLSGELKAVSHAS